MNLKRLKFVDKGFIFVLAIILVYGLIILKSATTGITPAGDPYYYIKKQLVWFGFGTAMAIFILRFDYLQLEKYSRFLYAFSILTLIMVLLFGEQLRGTTGWIALGPLPAFQPAEFTKILLIISFADFLNRRKGELNTFSQMLPCFIYMGIPFILIMLQPDLGTALVYIVVTLGMMFVAGANPKVLLGLITAMAMFIALMLFLHFRFDTWLPMDDYQIKRLTVFLDPYEDGKGGLGAGWNTIQSLTAIGNGGFWGTGLGKGTQVMLNFLPEHHTDFIYSVIGEELGFLGAIAVLVLYGILLIRAVIISYNAKDLFGTYLVVGIVSMWLFHIFENIGMCIGLMPITGIPLPFLSYGGSSLLTNMLGVGLILSVNIRGKNLVF